MTNDINPMAVCGRSCEECNELYPDSMCPKDIEFEDEEEEEDCPEDAEITHLMYINR